MIRLGSPAHGTVTNCTQNSARGIRGVTVWGLGGGCQGVWEYRGVGAQRELEHIKMVIRALQRLIYPPILNSDKIVIHQNCKCLLYLPI